MQEKYLPIGTVAMLKGGKKRVMITGFCAIPQEDPGKVYDYSGCVYPEGFITSNQVCLFNHDQIEKIFHVGLADQEETDFKVKLKEIVSSLNVTAKPAATPAPVSPEVNTPSPVPNEFFSASTTEAK
ncbi:MAG TPA: DUF4176 domain-containing protein [Bacilli bacterium]|nr:DUF4176 domain-containing protein [Bacilli bacterium]